MAGDGWWEATGRKRFMGYPSESTEYVIHGEKVWIWEGEDLDVEVSQASGQDQDG